MNRDNDKARILLLEDDSALRAVMREFLTLMGYDVLEADSEQAFRQLNRQHPFDLLLLDLNLPDGDGLGLLESLARERQAPVFVVSGRCDEASRIRALEAGADDYIAKPFNARELELRIRNFLRRQDNRDSAGDTDANDEGLALGRGDWQLMADQFLLAGPDQQTINLTRSERDLLETLLRAHGRLCSRRDLARAMSSPEDTTSDETVTVLIYRLRRKLDSAGIRDVAIETVAGAGYRLTRKSATNA